MTFSFDVMQRLTLACLVATALAGCPKSGNNSGAAPNQPAAADPGGVVGPMATPKPPATPAPTPTPPPVSSDRGISVETQASWLYYRGNLAALGNLSALAARYRLFVIEADPGLKFATKEQIITLKKGGQNRVLGYLPVGAQELSRPFYAAMADRLVDVALGPKADDPKAVWTNPATTAYATQVVNNLAHNIAGMGVDGFFLADVGLAEHLPDAADGPCDSRCRQGMLDLIQRLRLAQPTKLIVPAGTRSDLLRLATATNRQAIAPMLDGIVIAGVYAPQYDETAEAQLRAWRDAKLDVGGHPFWIGTFDRVPGCDGAAVKAAIAKAQVEGFSPGVYGTPNGVPCNE